MSCWGMFYTNDNTALMMSDISLYSRWLIGVAIVTTSTSKERPEVTWDMKTQEVNQSVSVPFGNPIINYSSHNRVYYSPHSSRSDIYTVACHIWIPQVDPRTPCPVTDLCSLCVCVCVSITTLVSATNAWKAKVRYQQKALNTGN